MNGAGRVADPRQKDLALADLMATRRWETMCRGSAWRTFSVVQNKPQRSGKQAGVEEDLVEGAW
jgi:hypothetical protein